MRKKATQAECLAGKTKLSKYEDLDVPLDDEQIFTKFVVANCLSLES